MGHGKGMGTLQLYTSQSKLGRPGGNARIAVSSPSRLKDIRLAVLRSLWFCEVGSAGQPHHGTATLIYQPD
eukprot:11861989-Karenia_brevis.AAC.1